MRKGPVFLVGMMGAGKTTLGRELSSQTGLPFLDTDAFIEKKNNRSIQRIFKEQGESAFRLMEKACFEELSSDGQWIATGGGFPCHHDLMPAMKNLGTVVYLKLSPEELWSRLKNDPQRPLLQRENPLAELQNILFNRKEIYEQATVTLNGNQPMEQLVRNVLDLNLI